MIYSSPIHELWQQLFEASKLSNLLDENDIDFNLRRIVEKLGKLLKYEYCNIGLYEDSELKDCGTWVYDGLHEEATDFLRNTTQRHKLETLVGSAIELIPKDAEKNYFQWSYSQQGEFTSRNLTKGFSRVNREILEGYRQIVLPSRGFYNFLVFGINNEKGEVLGYLHIVNKVEDGIVNPNTNFTEEEITFLRSFVNNIALLLENILFHRSSTSDEQELNSFYQLLEIDVLFKAILRYLNQEFNSLIGAYLTLAENGFENENEPMVVLRSISYLNREVEKKYSKLIEKGKESRIDLSLSGKIITDQLNLNISDSQDSIKFINHKVQDIRIMWDFVEETPYVIGIPIMKSLNFKSRDSKRSRDKVWGVICLQPLGNHDNEISRTRLNKIASHIQIIIEKIIYQNRYHQIESLNSMLAELEKDKSNALIDFSDFVNIVKDVTKVQACSVFTLTDDRTHLRLRATTAKSAYRNLTKHKSPLNIQDVIDGKEGLYSITNLERAGITGRAFIRKKPVIVYDVDKNKYTYKIFVEDTPDMHKSVIVLPLKDENGNFFGVLRCANKNKQDRLLPFFVDSDLELINLIVGITLSFLHDHIFRQRRQEAMTHFAHESRIPMQAIGDEYAILRYQLRRYFKDIPEGISKTMIKLQQNLGMLKNNVLISEAVFLEDTTKRKTLFKRLNLHQTIKKYRRLFNNRKLINSTSQAPDLFLDAGQIDQLFYNLLLNADRYSKKGTSIHIYYEVSTIYPTIGYHVFKIQNTGIGIPQGEEEEIFKAYYRSEEAKKTYPTGTGYGLKVCRDIMENHNGFIKVTSNSLPTEISIYFPDYLTKTQPK